MTIDSLKRPEIQLSEVLNRKWFDNTSQAWNSKEARFFMSLTHQEWIQELTNWKVFVTLTFRDFAYPDVAIKHWNELVHYLNKELLGNSYKRIVGHSYFSYILAIEYQKREVVHFHVLIDQPINYKMVHMIWNDRAGFAWIDTIENREKVVRYITKYVVKGGELEYYKAKFQLLERIKPYWWHENRKEIYK